MRQNMTREAYLMEYEAEFVEALNSYVLEEIKAQGISCVEGVKFTVETREKLLSNLKIAMEQNRLAIPYHRQLCQQINEQQYAYSKSGHLQFSHPANSHDDVLWSLALSVMATREPPRKEPAFTFG
jgi:phage FluMu gp28-like protein